MIINQNRWRYASKVFPSQLAQYRQMVVNHETGHWLGNGHAYCGGKGELAPVMQQQSKGLKGCRSTRGRSPASSNKPRSPD